MSTFFSNIVNSRYAFWIGFLTGVLFWWLIGKIRDRYPIIKEKIRVRIQLTRQGLLANTETRFRGDILRKAQHMHLAAPLFSLDEILEPVGVIAPPPLDSEENGIGGNDQEALKLPYLPDWPEFGAAYHWPVLTLSESLEGGANLILLGNPGSGKTVALASLASQLATNDAKAGTFSNYLPLLVHVTDLSPSLQEVARDPFEILMESISTQVSALTLPRLNVVVRNALETGKALLLLDGLDELPPDPIDLAVDYLALLLKKFPKARAIVAASPFYYDGLAALGFAPVAVSTWNLRDKSHFIQRWGELWDRYVLRGLPEITGRVDSLLINGWLSGSEVAGTPLELTLKTWAAYAGDGMGAGIRDSIEAYVLRMTVAIPKARPVLEKIASVMMLNANPLITVQEAERSIAEAWQSYSAPEILQPDDNQEVNPEAQSVKPNQAATATISGYAVSRALPDLVDRGLLVERKGSHISFFHPVIYGYLASSALSQVELPVQFGSQPQWVGKQQTMQFLSSCRDISNLISPLLDNQDDPLHRNLLNAARWLRESPKAARWRSSVMRQSAMLIQNEIFSLGVRARALTSLVLSNDPGVPILMRQLLTNPNENVRILAILGCGMLRDTRAYNDLIGLLNDPCLRVSQASLIALDALGTEQSRQAVVETLLQGSEPMRRIAAELLAANPEEGHETLKECLEMDDLLVRRAAIFGLAKIKQPWAIQILEKLQIEDGQWVIRNAASQVLEDAKKLDPMIPLPLGEITEAPWLIAYAAKLGMGISPGKPAMNLVVESLKDGTSDQRFAALDYLIRKGDTNVVPQVYQVLYGPNGDLREAAYNTLWHIAAAGTELPSPAQFNLG